MPKGTKVHRCVTKLKSKMGKAPAIRVCQKSTKQAYKTGRRAKRS